MLRLPLISPLLQALHRRKVRWAYNIVAAEDARERAWIESRYAGLSTEELAKRVSEAPDMGGAAFVELMDFAVNKGPATGSCTISFAQSPIEPAAPTPPFTEEAVKALAHTPNVRFPTLRDKDL